MANVSDFISKLKGGGARQNQFKVTLPFPGFASVGGETESMAFLCSATQLPSSELGELAEQLQQMRQEGAGMSEEEFRQSNEDAAKAVGGLTDADSDERLLNLTRMFEESAVAEDINNGRSISEGAVEKATRLIEQFFWQQSVERNLQRNHQSTRAPARYRKQVQEYFRRIAEGK